MNRRRTRIALRWAAVLAGLSLASCALLAGYGVALVDRAMTERGQPRSVPLLAAPLTLRDGDPWTEADLRAALLRRGFPPAPGAEVGAGEFGAAAGEITIGPGLVQGATRAVAVEFGASGIGIRTAAHGRVAAITLRASVAGTTAPGSVVAWPVSLTDISPGLITAIVDLEDRGFLSHAGLSLRGVVRAAWHDLVSGRVREGGSTITQQLAKLLLLRPDRRLSRKLLEAWLATLLEYRYDKRTILEAYLNRVYLGQDGGWQIQGVEAASHYYFGKRARDLELAESALLAGLVAAPNLFDPFTHRDQALSRRRTALQAMVREGHLGVAAAEAIGASALPAAARRFRWPPAAHYADWVHGTRTGRGSVASALDPDVQDAVRAGCDAGLRVLEARSARLRELRDTGDPIQVAVVVMAPDGRVVALTGSRRGLPGEFDRATEARRQIGSLVKPFVVAAAVERGWSLEATLADTPLSLVDGGRGWTPANSDGRYRGTVTVREALVHSLNVPMVRLGMAVGLPPIAERLTDLGFSLPKPAPSVLLGALEAAPLEVARAYAALASGGVLPVPTSEPVPAAGARRVFTGPAATDVLVALREVVRTGTAASLRGRVEGPLGGKTGTTDGRRDSWFVALRPRLVTVVWLGTDGNHETELFGATGALEVWQQIDSRLPAVFRGDTGEQPRPSRMDR